MSSMDSLSQMDRVQIMANGGSLRVSSALGQTDLVQLAANMKPNAMLVVENAAVLQQMVRVQIAANAKGIALFE